MSGAPYPRTTLNRERTKIMPDNPHDFRPADAAEHTWSQYAECSLYVEPNMFPSDQDHRGVAAAKSICAACPVRAECLAEAFENGEQYGVWGGLTADERLALRRRVNRANLRVRDTGTGELATLGDAITEAAEAGPYTEQGDGTEEDAAELNAVAA